MKSFVCVQNVQFQKQTKILLDGKSMELKSAALLPSKTLKRSETPSTASIGTLSESDNEDVKARKATEFQGDTTQTDTSGAESEIGKKKRGRKATW